MTEEHFNKVWQEVPASERPIRFRFADHGLGDVVHCCHVLKLYQAAGHPVEIQIEGNKEWAWRAAGIPICSGNDLPTHPYHYPPHFFDLSLPDAEQSKIAHLPEVDPRVVPRLGTKAEVWELICNSTIDATTAVSAEALDEAKEFLAGLPKPIVLLHSKGTNWQAEKSIPDPVAFQLILDLLNETGGSVVTLDWDGRAPTLGHRNVRQIKPNWGHITLEQFGALCILSDLMIGIDSGPFHLAGWFDIPTLFVGRKIPAVRCCIPDPMATYLVPSKDHEHWAARDARWRFAEYDGEDVTSRDIVSTAVSILTPRTGSVMPPLQPFEVVGEYLYKRVGHDERPLELLDDGKIGTGAAGRERTWRLVPTPTGQSLIIYGDNGGDTCHLLRDADGVWRGRWLDFERMPIELSMVSRPEVVTVTAADLVPMDDAQAAGVLKAIREQVSPPRQWWHPSDSKPDAPIEFYVGIPTYCCFDLLDLCIEAVLASDWLPKRIYVIDNSQGRYPGHHSRRVQVFTPPRNLGAGGAWNFLLPTMHEYPCIMLNDDIEIAPDLLRAMVQCPAQFVVGDGRSAFTACMIRQEAWEKVGPLDPEFWPAYYEDCDWCYRAKLLGYQPVCPPSGGYKNNGPSATKARMTETDRSILNHHYAINTGYYRAKWGGGPHEETFTVPFNGVAKS